MITESCTIYGKLGDRSRVVFRPAAGTTIWVKTKGEVGGSNDNQFVLDNTSGATGTVNLLITDNVRFDASNKPIFTVQSVENLITSGKSFQFATETSLMNKETVTNSEGKEELKYPLVNAVNFNIYSTKTKLDSEGKPIAGTTITTSAKNATRIIANIKAPYMKLSFDSGGGKELGVDILYNGFKVTGEANSKQIGGIGCCIVNDFYSQNNWVLLFVGKKGMTGGDDFEDALMKNWHVEYYENY